MTVSLFGLDYDVLRGSAANTCEEQQSCGCGGKMHSYNCRRSSTAAPRGVIAIAAGSPSGTSRGEACSFRFCLLRT
jgi:hypothetical protein